MIIRLLVWLAMLSSLGAGVTALRADAPVQGAAMEKSIPFDQLGAEAQKQYTGDGIGITPTAEGAQLRTVFQRLEGQATRDGLWLTSTRERDAGKAERFRVVATGVGRQDGGALTDHLTLLPRTGTVTATAECVTFARAGLTEEYRVSTDGVRQDFVIAERPPGGGALQVALEVTGAQVAEAHYGAKLTLAGSGRELAYSRLHVTDATGRPLEARLEVSSANRLTVRVEDAGATYPVRIDPTFSDADWVSLNPGLPGTDGDVYATATDSSGNLYIGGYFGVAGTVAANSIAKWNGSAWSAVGTGMVGGQVFALAVNGTDLYAGGLFITAGGVSARYIAKWNGSVWSALGTGVNSNVYALAVAGTDLYVGGYFSTAGGVAASRIAKWNGSAWSALDSGTDSVVRALAVSGTDLYAGGEFTTAGGMANTNGIAKWNGSAWSAVGSGVAGGYVFALAVNGTDLYAGGTFATAGGVASTRSIAKWNGSGWSALGTGMNSSVSALAFIGTDLYAGGEFTTAGGVSASEIAKWDGSGWSALGWGTSGGVKALTVIGTNLYVGGGVTAAGRLPGNHIAKWSGGAWSALGSGIDHYVGALAVSGTDLYAGGSFIMTGGGVAASRIAKWNGSEWSPLGLGLNATVGALAVSGTDLYVGGDFTTAGGVAANRIAKWNGSEWSALGSGLDRYVRALAVSGAVLYVGGHFTTAGGVDASRIAQWNGSEWSALGSGMNDVVTALAVSGSDLYAGGMFTSAGGVANTSGIAKWNGSMWSALGSGMNSHVYALALSGTDLYAGGDFTTAGGSGASRIAKWNGSAWSSLGLGVNSGVSSLAVSGTDLYAGGGFTAAGGSANIRYIAKWNGSLWSPLGSGLNNAVSKLAVSPANQLFVAGAFGLAGTTVSPFVAQADLTGSSNADLTGLLTSAGVLSPLFDSAITEYTQATTSATLTVTPTVAQPNATVTVNGVPVASGAATSPIALAAGSNTITVLVTALNGTTTKTYTIAVTADIPRIEIKTWDSTGEISLTDGGTTPMDIGSAGVGYFSERTFTISNTGLAPLSVTSFTVDGLDPGCFSGVPPPYTPLPFSIPSPGGNTFTVRFSPDHVGQHGGVLHVLTNDPHAPSFDIPLSGTGRVASHGVISIDRPPGSVIDVLEHNDDERLVFIPISRTGGVDGDVGFTISTGGGTATLYTDYLPPTNPRTINNQMTGTGVPITIRRSGFPLGENEPNETFTVTISSATGGATLGAVKTVTVRIIDFEDAAPPTPPVINAPAVDALVTLTSEGKFLVTGTAKDDKGVDSVEVKINGNVVGNAVLSAPGTPSTNWSLLLSPGAGANVLAVQSMDTQGKISPEVTRNFRAPGPLAVTVNAAQGSVTTGYAPTSYREIGKSYSIAASAKTTPVPGFVFDRWVVGGGYDEGDIGATLDSIRLPALTFTMRAGLTLTAQFIGNPFAAEAGAYDGLVRTATGFTPGTATEGHFHVDLQSTGGFSGKLTLDGLVLNVNGVFDNEGVARFGTTRATKVKVTRTGKPSVEVGLRLTDLDPPGGTDDVITGTVTQYYRAATAGVSDVVARRAVVPADILSYVPTGSSALFTSVITPQALVNQPAGLTVEDYPQGHSLANITVGKTGTVTFVGTLADGTTPVSISSTISKTGNSPLFAQLYGKLGFLSGLLHLNHTAAESDMTAEDMLWAKPYSDLQHYQYGWPEVIKVDLRGARYLIPPSNSVLHTPDGTGAPDADTRGDMLPVPDADGNARLTWTLPLMTDVLKAVKVSTSDGVLKVNPADAGFSLTITRSTGRISGFFTHPGDGSKPTYQGILYQKGTTPGAYGWFLTPAPNVKTYDGQGGTVELRYQP